MTYHFETCDSVVGVQMRAAKSCRVRCWLHIETSKLRNLEFQLSLTNVGRDALLVRIKDMSILLKVMSQS